METNAHVPFHAVYMKKNVQYCTIFKMAARKAKIAHCFPRLCIIFPQKIVIFGKKKTLFISHLQRRRFFSVFRKIVRQKSPIEWDRKSAVHLRAHLFNSRGPEAILIYRPNFRNILVCYLVCYFKSWLLGENRIKRRKINSLELP